MTEVRDLSHLLPSPEALRARAERSAEASLLSQLLRGLGASRSMVLEGERESGDGRLSLAWFSHRFPTFPFSVATAVRTDTQIQDFFEHPTKTKPFAEFTKLFDGVWKTEPCVLLFKATGFSALALYTSPQVGNQVGIALRFTVRGNSFYVSTLKEFANAYRERAGAMDS